MATAKTIYIGKLRTDNTHLESGTIIQTDAPKDNHGLGEAFSPTDLVATALGACMISIIGIAAKEKGWNIAGSDTETTKIMASNPRRIAEIKVALHLKGIPQEDRAYAERLAHNCPVAKSIHPDIIQDISFKYE